MHPSARSSAQSLEVILTVEVLAPIVDALIAVLAAIAELLLGLARCGARSVRYAFSPAYRETKHEQLRGRGLLYRAVYASWGVIALSAWIVLVASLIYWASTPEPTPAEACAKIELQQLAKCAHAVREAMPK
jgi:hypothetical protein